MNCLSSHWLLISSYTCPFQIGLQRFPTVWSFSLLFCWLNPFSSRTNRNHIQYLTQCENPEMLRDFLWLYRSCCHLWEHVWKYCHIAKTNTGSSQAVLCFCRVGDRWLKQYTVQKLYACISTVQTSVLHKVWMYEGENKWLKMWDGNTNTETFFPPPSSFTNIPGVELEAQFTLPF